VDAAVSTFHALFLEVLPSLENSINVMWDATVSALAAKPIVAARALAIPLRERLRVETNTKLLIRERPREPLAVLSETLSVLSLDIAPYVRPAGDDWTLADMWIGLHALPQDDRNDFVAQYRERLIERGQHRAPMGEKLAITKRDPRLYRPDGIPEEREIWRIYPLHDELDPDAFDWLEGLIYAAARATANARKGSLP
jgi:hypothetical protein